MASRSQYGFTLVELVVTLIIVGILAATAVPRFFDRQDYDARAFRDATQTLLGYAQKAAVAQRRTVCVRTVTTAIATKAWLTIRSSNGDAACGAMASPIAALPGGEVGLEGPDGTPFFTITAPSSTGYASGPPNFRFRALGDTNLLANQVIGFTGAVVNLTVESNTGYVH